MNWIIISDTYRHIDWVMKYMCNKYADDIIATSKIYHAILFDDGIEINEFMFVNNDLSKIRGMKADIYISIEDFREMWLLT